LLRWHGGLAGWVAVVGEELMSKGLPCWHHWRDCESGTQVLVVFDWHRIGWAWNVSSPAPDIPALEFGPVEIEFGFDSEEPLGGIKNLGMEMLRKRIIGLDFSEGRK
jgi:hypothetical protein